MPEVPSNTNSRTEADAVAQIAREGLEPQLRGAEQLAQPFIVFPRSENIKSLEQMMQRPLRKKGLFAALTSDAFIEYALRHRTPGLLLSGVVTTAGGSFVAHLDHHTPNTAKCEIASEANKPSWCEHKIQLALQPSPEWVKWLANDNKPLEQVPFAQFIEDNAADIYVPEDTKFPDAAMMMTVATNLEATQEVEFSSGIKLQNGQQQLRYQEKINGQIQGEANLVIPAKFAIAVQPFIGAPKYPLIARLRYYLSRGKVSFRYELERPYRVIEDAYKSEKTKIEAALGQPVLLGTWS